MSTKSTPKSRTPRRAGTYESGFAPAEVAEAV